MDGALAATSLQTVVKHYNINQQAVENAPAVENMSFREMDPDELEKLDLELHQILLQIQTYYTSLSKHLQYVIKQSPP